MTSHYADVSRAWDIMDIMNNIEVWLVCEQGAEAVMIWEGGKNSRLEEIAQGGVNVIFIPYQLLLGWSNQEGEMVGCEACMRMMNSVYRIIVDNLMGGGHLENLDLDELIILKRNIEKEGWN